MKTVYPPRHPASLDTPGERRPAPSPAAERAPESAPGGAPAAAPAGSDEGAGASDSRTGADDRP